MPRFAYEARDEGGAPIRGMEIALDEFDLDRRLSQQQLFLVQARTLRGRRRLKISSQALIDFCYHLSVVVEAGIPMLQGLRDLEQQNEGEFGDVIGDIAARIEGGALLSEAMLEHERIFPELIRAVVRASEVSGQLDRALNDLVRYLEWREDLRRQVSSAVSYPIIVLTGVVGLLGVIFTYVLPRFLAIFVELGVELPPATRALLALQEFINSYGLLILGSLAALVAASVVYVHTGKGRLHFDGIKLHLPVFGSLLSMIEAARFSHNLGLLYSAGLPIPKCLEMVEAIVQNRALRHAVARTRDSIDRGGGLADALASGRFLPPIVTRMVSIGEASGRLDQALERAASFFDREVPVIIARVLLLFNTGIIVLMGCTVVIIALAIFFPLYSMMGELNASGG